MNFIHAWQVARRHDALRRQNAAAEYNQILRRVLCASGENRQAQIPAGRIERSFLHRVAVQHDRSAGSVAGFGEHGRRCAQSRYAAARRKVFGVVNYYIGSSKLSLWWNEEVYLRRRDEKDL